MIGSRFYKKIDEKFIEVLAEKFSKESKEFKRLKNNDIEDYIRRKNEYISLNKDNWIKDTIKILQNSELVQMYDENDSLIDTKREALTEYLSQEKNIVPLISRVEQLEISLRKSIN